MDLLEYIQNNTMIICENNYKKYILKRFNEEKIFLNVKILTKKEFMAEYLFKWNEKTVSYLVNKYKLKVDVVKMYLNNLYYIDELKKYYSHKLNFLVDLKKELLINNLLSYNENFKRYVKDFKVIVVGYPYLDNYEIKVFEEINALIIEDTKDYHHKLVYEFETMEEEINFVCKSICELLNKNVSINDIKLVGVSDDYYNDLERIFNFYHIPIKISTGNSLYSNAIVQKFLNNYDLGIENSLNLIKNENSEVVSKIINICNKYSFESHKEKVKSLIIADLKNTKLNNFKLKNYVELLDIFDPFAKEYVFLMNFNVGNMPLSFKDEEYITDNIKEELEMDYTNIKNMKYKESTKNKIKSIKNLVISYKLKSSKGEFYPSSLIKELNLEVEKKENNILDSYSYENDLLTYAKMEDNFKKYGNISDNYYIYKNSLGKTTYGTYDNRFTGIDKFSLREYLKGKLTLSYSSLNNYNKCAFRYYLSNILRLDKYEESFEAFIGSIFHDVLEKCFINNLGVEEEVNNYVQNSGKTLTIKERFFINKVIKDIEFVIRILNSQKDNCALDQAMYEKNIVIDKSRDILVEFVGFVDKILYKESDNKTLVSIIDYKTGFIDIDLKYIPYGLSLQLPIYLYLVKKSNLFVNPQFVGFYLQYILDKDIVRDNKKSYEEQKVDNLKLMGYSNSDVHSLVEFDKTFSNSSLIRGMKTKANGDFSTYAKVLTDNEIEKITTLTEENIDKAIDKILDGDFNINPKKIGYAKDIGCMYCKFSDICFKSENNYVIFDDIKTLDFLKEE